MAQILLFLARKQHFVVSPTFQELNMIMKIIPGAILAAFAAGTANAASFVNGNFESGDTTGWTAVGDFYRNSYNNTTLTPALVLSNATTNNRSAIVSTGYVDPNVGAALGSTVYSGKNSYREIGRAHV